MDNCGCVVNFKNMLIIMIFNMGVEIILENFEDLDVLGDDYRVEIINIIKEEVFDYLKENLRLEFFNWIDE